MKTFEEQLTAWIDGQLDERERVAFEARLEAEPELRAERASARQLGDLLRTQGAAPALTNGDFFNLGILQRIAEPASVPAPGPRGWLGLSRLAWSGFGFLAAALVLFVTIIPHGAVGKNYVAQVLTARPGDRGLSATAFYSNENKLTVLWLDGDADSAPRPPATH